MITAKGYILTRAPKNEFYKYELTYDNLDDVMFHIVLQGVHKTLNQSVEKIKAIVNSRPDDKKVIYQFIDESNQVIMAQLEVTENDIDTERKR